MTNQIRSLVPFVAAAALSIATVGCTSSATVDAATASSASSISSMELAVMGSSRTATKVHALLKSNGDSDGVKRSLDVAIDAEANEEISLAVGEHVLAIVLTDEGGALLGSGTTTFTTEANVKVLVILDVDSMIDGEDISAEVADADGSASAGSTEESTDAEASAGLAVSGSAEGDADVCADACQTDALTDLLEDCGL